MNVTENSSLYEYLNSTGVSTIRNVFYDVINFFALINLLLDAYFLPTTLILGSINNTLCLLVFGFSNEFYNRTSKVSCFCS